MFSYKSKPRLTCLTMITMLSMASSLSLGLTPSMACEAPAGSTVQANTHSGLSLESIITTLGQGEDPVMMSALRRAFDLSPALKIHYEIPCAKRVVRGY